MRRLITTSLILFQVAGFAATDTGKLLGPAGLVDKTMNPAISVNGLFLGNYGTALEGARGVRIQEIEAQFTASVDPYFFANVVLTSDAGTFIRPEEAYVSTLSLPVVTFKVGQFLAAFGKNNTVHTHAQPLIDRPLVTKTMLGADGFKSVGLEADILLPLPWYSDLTVAALSGNPAVPFQSPSDENLAGVARLENLFDLTDTTTLGIGLSYSGGENIARTRSHFAGADLTFKYVTSKGRGDFAVIWSNEYIRGWRKDFTSLATPDWDGGNGLYSTLLTRFTRRFWIGGRFDRLSLTNGATTKQTAENLVIAYVPTEFSAIRLQGGLSQADGRSGSQWQTLLQMNFTIGSHPAHAY